MTARVTAQHLRDESGFTLVELLVVMVVSIVVLLAVLDTFDSFTSNAARQTKITDANDKVRTTMDKIVSDLRQARTLEVADANDLVYTVTDSATQTRRERICLDSASRLWRASVTTSSPPAVPIASGTPCPTPSSGAFQIANLVSANSAANPLFRFDSATPASVRSVGLTFALNAGNAGRTDVSTLRASAFVRAQRETALAVTPPQISTTCSSSGVPTLTLSSSVGPLTVTYTDLNGTTLGTTVAGSALSLASASTTVVANISSSSGAVTQLLKTILC